MTSSSEEYKQKDVVYEDVETGNQYEIHGIEDTVDGIVIFGHDTGA